MAGGSRGRIVRADVLVVGGGIAGIEAALAVGACGRTAHVLERQPALGGHMARFESIFPALDRADLILASRLDALRAQPKIGVSTCSEVTAVEGAAGHFHVRIAQRARHVDEARCTACLDCVDACLHADARFPDEFNLGLSNRKPVFLPFPGAVPNAVVIDPATCAAFTPAGCERPCVAACGDRGAIDLSQRDTVTTMEVGAVILATGFRPFDVSRTPFYGYGTYPNVYTSLEVERLLNRSGPTGGELTLRDGRPPRAIGIVHCVGSRDTSTNRWCSRVCCMASLKQAHLLKARTGAELFNFYVDMRTPGVAFEEFYQRLLDEAVHFIRGRVAEITDCVLDPSEEGKLVIRVEDTLLGVIRRVPVDMVVLSVGMEPHADAQHVARLFGIDCTADGFLLDGHQKLGASPPTVAPGVFVAGCCEAPNDLRAVAAQARAAAVDALAVVDGRFPGS